MTNAPVAHDLKLIIDTIPALAWSARPDGGAEFFNQHYLNFVGLAADQAEGWGWTAAVHPDDLPGLTTAWRHMLASGAPGEAEARLRGRDGAYRWFLFRANPLRDEGGRITRWYGVNTDIEDRKHAEEALHRARTELAHVARVTTLSTLTASIAHEVCQPLTGVMTNAGTCLRMLGAAHPNVGGARDTARRVIRDAQRASDILSRLRVLVSNRECALDAVDLAEAAREVLSLAARELYAHRVSVVTELADDVGAVGGDRVQLQQVILNLVLNAAEAMQGVDDRERVLTVRTEREDADRTRLVVRDAGVGVDPHAMGTLFEAFYTTKPNGMGVGLSVSRAIIERHGGRLWAEANDGPGATFAFSLPCWDPGSAHAPGSSGAT